VKPLTLRLQAFGSYAGVLEIDFARLGRHGVFSITGPTGAGKSTIFDAIVYALYDDLPGFRTDSHVRSQYAEAGTATSVALTFEADGKEWVVERSPAQPRPRKRGGGAPVTDDSRVVLREAGADGGGLTRKQAVADELVRLVGLTKDQFEQVVLIPQGKFEEVLKAETKDRAELLGRLFPVDVFRRTTEALKEAAAGRRSSYEALHGSGAALVEQIRGDLVEAFDLAPDGLGPPVPDGGPLTAEGFDLEHLDGHRTALGELAAALAQALDAAAAGLEVARTRRTEAEAMAARWDRWQSDQQEARAFPGQEAEDARIHEALDRARTVARMGPALLQWRSASDALAGAAADERRLRPAIDAAWAEEYDREALASASGTTSLAARVGADADLLEAADAVHGDLARRGAVLDAADRALVERDRAMTAAAAALEASEGEIATVRAALGDATVRAAGRADAQVRVHELELVAAAVGRRDSALAEVDRHRATLDAAIRAEDGAAAQVIALRTAWRAGLAGRLAADLVAGEPCPTCGATAHPAPARPGTDAPTDETLAEAEDALRLRSEASQAERVRLAAAEATAASAAASVTGDGDDLADRLDAARSRLVGCVAAEEESARYRDELDTREQGLRADRAAAAAESEALESARAAQGARRDQWTGERDAFIAAHGTFAPMAEAARRRRALADGLASLASTLQSAHDAASARDQGLAALGPTLAEFGVDDPAALGRWARPGEEVADGEQALAVRAEHRREVTTRLREYVEASGPQDRPDVAPLVEVERAATHRYEDLFRRHAVVSSRIDAVDTASAELATRTGEVEVARRLKEEAETVYSACAGLGAGSVGSRVSLHNWVLAYYLRQVLAQANVRLDTMTGGRYALELDRGSGDGRRASGLDLSVLDAETGQRRPATTLSGGETFMAALALALGLADVVAAGSNHDIGALFVDEGFGSLDGESLDTVIDVLRSLQDGGRTVGVISHVQELKDALPNGITIASTNQGSVATIHYPEW